MKKVIHYKEKFSDWMRKQDAKVSYLEKTFFPQKRHTKVENKRVEKRDTAQI